MKITLFGGTIRLLPPRRSRGIAATGSERLEDSIEILNSLRLTTDHHAVTACKAPDTSAGPHVQVANTFGLQFLGPPDVINIVRVPTINDDIARLHQLNEVTHSAVDHSGGNHQPGSPRRLQFRHKIIKGLRSRGPFSRKLPDSIRTSSKRNAFMAAAQQAAYHVGAHAPKADHS